MHVHRRERDSRPGFELNHVAPSGGLVCEDTTPTRNYLTSQRHALVGAHHVRDNALLRVQTALWCRQFINASIPVWIKGQIYNSSVQLLRP